MRKLLKLSVVGIGIALTLFSIYIVGIDICTGGSVHYTNYSYTRMVIGTSLIGLGFSLPGVIYDVDRIPYVWKALIHMGIGCVIMFFIGYKLGWYEWFEKRNFLWQIICVQVFLACIIWISFVIRDVRMAKRINEKLKKINNKQNKNEKA